MLYVKGVCLNCKERNVTFTKDGVQKGFKAHRCCLHQPDSDFDPIYVETGEAALVRGKAYRMAVRVSTFKDREGNTKIQYSTMKNHPPQELSPAKSAAA